MHTWISFSLLIPSLGMHGVRIWTEDPQRFISPDLFCDSSILSAKHQLTLQTFSLQSSYLVKSCISVSLSFEYALTLNDINVSTADVKIYKHCGVNISFYSWALTLQLVSLTVLQRVCCHVQRCLTFCIQKNSVETPTENCGKSVSVEVAWRALKVFTDMGC